MASVTFRYIETADGIKTEPCNQSELIESLGVKQPIQLLTSDQDGTLIVNIDVLKAQDDERAIINRADLKNIRWYENGAEVTPTQESVEEWKFTGLNNLDFVRTGELYNP